MIILRIEHEIQVIHISVALCRPMLFNILRYAISRNDAPYLKLPVWQNMSYH